MALRLLHSRRADGHFPLHFRGHGCDGGLRARQHPQDLWSWQCVSLLCEARDAIFLSKGIWRTVGLLQVGIAYAVGIALALAVCAVRRAESASHSVRMGIEMFDIHRAFQGVILAQALLSMPSFCGGSPLERP